MRRLDPLEFPCHGVRLIEASAGTGKTYIIATLYLRLLLERAYSVRNILVVTFTQAATEELRDRIRGRLREALAVLRGEAAEDVTLEGLLATVPDRKAAAAHLTNELACLDEAAIFTIHGFCQRMLQEHAFESGMPFDAQLITDESELLGEVVNDFWRRSFYADGAAADIAAQRWGTPQGLAREVRSYVNRSGRILLPEVAELPCSPAHFRRAYQEAGALWRDQREIITDMLHQSKAISRAKDAYKHEVLEEAVAALDAFFATQPPVYYLPTGFPLFTAEKLAASILKRTNGARAPTHPFFERAQVLAEIRRAKELALLVEAIDHCRRMLGLRKRERGLIAFDDLLRGLGEALDRDGGMELASRITGRFPVALIDEFQDTDPEQYRVFATLYGQRPNAGLFLIGDPKQAIYSFRGADVFTYMLAKSDTDPDRDRFTLGTNWRSASRLVEGVNALFSMNPAPFVYQGHIDFLPVEPAGKADEKPLLIDSQPPTPFHVWFVPRGADNTDRGAGKIINKGWAVTHLSAACAEEIARLLQLGREGRAICEDVALTPRDIAVLVRDRYEAEAIRNALADRGVGSVYYSRDSVFETEEARELLHLLMAVAEPDDEGALRSALATSLLGLTAGELEALCTDEIAWEQRVEQTHRSHQQWLVHGFMAMFRRLLHEQDIPRRLATLPDGERRLTNLLQLGELLQGASREHHGIETLLRWYAQQCADPDGESEEQQLRLESDEALIKIVTIHKSKGLEYPIVLLPFLWGARPLRKNGPLLFHAEDASRELRLDVTGLPEHYAVAERERLAEDLRLVYVALTRAKYLCYFSWGHFKEADRSALAWLLHGDAATDSVDALAERFARLDDDAMRGRLDALANRGSGSFYIGEPPLPTDFLYRPPREETFRAQARQADRSVVQQWRVASFTALSAGRWEIEHLDDTRVDEEGRATAVKDARDILHFPRGRRTGVFLHMLLQQLDFPAARGETLTREVGTLLARYGFGAEWQPVVERMVEDVLDTPLEPGGGLRLRDIPRGRRLDELEFHYPLAKLRDADLSACLAGLSTRRIDRPALRFDPVAGVMRGFIDLVFEHDGRYFVVDYKSNDLGETLASYSPCRLAEAVAHHRYDLQYSIYAVALHRYLRHRMAGYRYGEHFGGIYYLFLRGMRPAAGTDHGVFFTRPEEEHIARLDRLFSGLEQTA